MVDLKSALMIISITTATLLVFFILIDHFKKKEKGIKNNREVDRLRKLVAPSKLLTPHERRMYYMLRSVTPLEFDIIYEVSFNAIIKCKDIGLRNKFNRTSVDFLIVDKNFIPILCVELDDDTHRMKSVQIKDEFRDNLLSAVDIPTERFKGLPKNKNEIKFRLEEYFKNHKQSTIYEQLIKEA